MKYKDNTDDLPILGKAEVGSSILPGGTIPALADPGSARAGANLSISIKYLSDRLDISRPAQASSRLGQADWNRSWMPAMPTGPLA
ncbi:hypothetical protein ABC365_02190 [Brevundimonas sp. 3P9-tot-E]|uniref:hypothetical protein n=1 Tax=unclassified Brevundimonas TaxID=2622653 RepID=UPI0039A30679